MGSYRYIKRSVDLCASALGLLVCAPVMAIVALVIWLDLGRPILFTQERPGLGETPFRLYKFRTMKQAYDDSGNPLPDAMRLGRVGRLLRKMSLDEIPQLWNVLRGDMSLVGPRPLFMHYLPYYSSRERLRHTVRPGITGLAQVRGRNRLSWDEKLELDVQYVENIGFWADIRILAETFVRVLKSEDVLDAAPEGPLHLLREKQRGVVANGGEIRP